MDVITGICQNFVNVIVFHRTSLTSTAGGIAQLFVPVLFISQECVEICICLIVCSANNNNDNDGNNNNDNDNDSNNNNNNK